MDRRYSRQEVLHYVGKAGQILLSSRRVAIVGCGALGSVSAELLARAGVGHLVLVDHDIVELSNLQRQSLYTEKDISMPKASSLKEHISRVNSSLDVSAFDVNLDFENISKILSDVSLVLDCTDNIDTRLLLNEFCVKKKIPWIHAAAIQEKGSLLNFIPGSPCFKCVFVQVTEAGSCEQLGILNSTSHIVASMQVVEAMKILLGKEPEKDFLRVDVWKHTVDKFKVKKLYNCPVCSGQFEILEGRLPDFIVKECTTKKGWTVKPKSNIKLNLNAIKKKFEVVLDASILLVLDYEGEIIVHGYGELLFKQLKDEKRIRQIADEIYRVGGAI